MAQRLGWLYLDTGAMYRAVGLAFRERSLPFTEDAAAALVPDLTVDLTPGPDGVHVALNGRDVTAQIRTAQAASDASRASALGPVRNALVALQRRVADRQPDDGGTVAEGRDIGTVVFPDADVKFFMVADLDARARRRHDDLARADPDAPAFETVRDELAERDRRDMARTLAPLKPAPDAVVLDTTAIGPDEQVERVLDAVASARPA